METLLSIIGGGATGLLGTMFDRVFGYYEKIEERKFILQKHELDSIERAKDRESQANISEINNSAKLVETSYAHDTNFGTGSQWVINLLRLVRPTITLILWFLVALIWISVGEDYDFKGQIISTVLYCATAATLWWFGTRDNKKSR